MSKLTLRSIAPLTIAFGLSFIAAAQSRPFVSFDVPGAVGNTNPLRINSAGQVVGFALSDTYHGFVRNPDGQITLVDVPGAARTYAVAINSSGQIVGTASQTDFGLQHGFLRSNGNHFTEIFYPGAIQTFPISINDSGAITGDYVDSHSVFHGFVRDASGVYTSFDAPGAGTASGQGTTPKALNNAGQIAGYYLGPTGTHAFIRDAAGTITSFDGPGAMTTVAVGINDSGDITGDYTAGTGTWIGFVRHSDGSLTSFTVLGSKTNFPASINASGYICGLADSSQQINTGFLRDASGNFILYSGPQPNKAGACVDVNENLRATGTYKDNSGVSHAWVK